MKGRIPHMRYETLKKENPELYETLKLTPPLKKSGRITTRRMKDNSDLYLWKKPRPSQADATIVDILVTKMVSNQKQKQKKPKA